MQVGRVNATQKGSPRGQSKVYCRNANECSPLSVALWAPAPPKGSLSCIAAYFEFKFVEKGTLK